MINKVEKHETDETCNFCGKEEVVNQYGNKSCDNYDCPAHRSSTDIHWNSTDEEIEEWREENDPSKNMDVYTVKVRDGDEVTHINVRADRFEIEGGVLVFYEATESAASLTDLNDDERTVAFNEWSEVEKQ